MECHGLDLPIVQDRTADVIVVAVDAAVAGAAGAVTIGAVGLADRGKVADESAAVETGKRVGV